MNGTAPKDCLPEAAEARSSRGRTCVGAVVLLLAAVARWSGAWAGARIMDPDAGVVALMARHMAKGRAFPAFFYGQAYMGPIEPAMSALLCRMFGFSGYVVNLGTAIFGFLVVLVLWRWGCAMGGVWGGLCAALPCAIGPQEFAWFMATPRGGYAAATLLQTIFLAGAAHAAARVRKGDRVPIIHAVGLGLAGGLAWWCDFITASALLAGAIVLAVGLRGRVWNRLVGWAMTGFFLGSGPFWIWNIRHDWASLRIAGAVEATPLSRGLHLLRSHGLRLMAVKTSASFASWLELALFVSMALAGLVALIAAFRRRRARDFPIVTAGTVVALHLAVALLLYLRSAFIARNTARYLVPLVPSLAMLGAVAAGKWPQKRPVGVALAGIALLTAILQSGYFREVALRRDRSRQQFSTDERMARTLEAWRIEAVYAHFHYHPFNFALGERWVFTDGLGDRVPGYAERAEAAERVGFLDNRFGASTLAALAGGQSRQTQVDGILLDGQFVPPSAPLEEVPPSRWSAIADLEENDLAGVLADRDADTEWTVPRGRTAETGFVIRFARTERPAMLRLCLGASDFVHDEAEVERRDPRDGRWHAVHPSHTVPQMHWSGPRPFWRGRRFRVEYVWPGEDTDALRWRVRPTPGHEGAAGGRIFEVQVFSKSERVEPAESEAVAELMAALQKSGIRRAYADRWVSNVIATRAPAVDVEREIPGGAFGAGGGIVWAEGSALIVREHDAPQTRSVLNAAGLRFAEISIMPWRLFVAAPPPLEADPPVYWTGYTLFRGQFATDWANRMRRAIARLETPAGEEQAVAWLAELRRRHPEWLSAATPLVCALEERHPGLLPLDIVAEWRDRSRPQIPIPAEFEDGLTLLGLRVVPSTVPRGGQVRICYYWRCPPHYAPTNKAVFVHLQCGSFRFQDDHPLPFNRRTPHLPPDLVWREERLVTVPSNAPKGPVHLAIGVYNPSTKRRDRVRSSLQIRRRKVVYGPLLYVAAGHDESIRADGEGEHP